MLLYGHHEYDHERSSTSLTTTLKLRPNKPDNIINKAMNLKVTQVAQKAKREQSCE